MRYIVITLGIFLVLLGVAYGHTVNCGDEPKDLLADEFSRIRKISILLFFLFCVITLVWIWFDI